MVGPLSKNKGKGTHKVTLSSETFFMMDRVLPRSNFEKYTSAQNGINFKKVIFEATKVLVLKRGAAFSAHFNIAYAEIKLDHER